MAQRRKKKMRVVLDTNILLVSIASKSKYRIIFENILSENIELVVSTEILNEYAEVIENKTNSFIANNILETLISLPNIKLTTPFYDWNLIDNDKDDNKFVNAYLSSNANILVSNDKHYNILAKIDFPKVNVMDIEMFLKLF